MGAYIIQDETIKANIDTFTDWTKKKHASYFYYVGYGSPFPKEWVEQVKAAGGFPHIAWEPNNGLQDVQDNAYLRKFALDAKESGVPIFLRYASEMNGTWTEYSGKGKEELYKQKWKLVHSVMSKTAPNVMMTWTVFTFPEEPMMKYYPGDEYVDWVGVNIYNVMYHNNDINQRADKEDPLELLDYVYKEFSYRKPIQISEFGVTHYTITDKKYHVNFAMDKIARLYNTLPTKYPRVKSIYYFDVNNLVNAPAGRKINDYSLTSDKNVLAVYNKAIQNPYYLTDIAGALVQESRKETYSYRTFLFYKNGSLYVDLSFYQNYLRLKSTKKQNQVTLSDGVKSKTYTFTLGSVKRVGYLKPDVIQGLPLREVAEYFGYKLNLEQLKEETNIYLVKK